MIAVRLTDGMPGGRAVGTITTLWRIEGQPGLWRFLRNVGANDLADAVQNANHKIADYQAGERTLSAMFIRETEIEKVMRLALDLK